MQKPEDYIGDLNWACPSGYVDVTCFMDDKRHGIAGPDHPYYRARNTIASVIAAHPGLDPEALADAILTEF